MTLHHLTKSDFKLGCDCPFKLKYKKAGYPNNLKDNEMLDFFAEAGFMVEAIAHAVMEANPAVEFEKTLTAGRYMARLDGFEQFADHIVLTEIKAKSVESANPEQFFKKRTREVNGDWLEYMLDITFQVMVAEACYPGLTVVPRLCMVNKNKPCSIEAVYAKIDLLEDSKDRDRSLPRAVYTGDRAALRADHFLEFIDVRECVDLLMPEVKAKAAELLDFLDGRRPDITPQIGLSPCKTCEYRDAVKPASGNGTATDIGKSANLNDSRDGFAECWGPTPPRGQSVLDMYRAGNGSNELKAEVARRIAERNLALVDVPLELLAGGGSYGPTRRNQRQAAVTGSEVIGDGLGAALKGLEYPLHFIDFEASRIPVPYRPGMKPYEVVAFQFSCHTLESPTSDRLVHKAWLNLRDVYPNEEFLRELRAAIGEKGTVFTWSGYELTTLRHVRRQLRERDLMTPELASWLTGLIGPAPAVGEEDKTVGRRVVDLLKISQAHYAHPLMRGSHSIKKVLDAMWSDAPHLWNDPWFAEYYRTTSDGRVLDPYSTLAKPPLNIDLGDTDESDDEAVTDGVGAMRAYQDMLYGEHKNDLSMRDKMRDSLLRYCGLDTAAMVIIWKHWCMSHPDTKLT
ncbi:MAG: DUF2779 domain-containing protein [Ilumatobacteraceae bacterium]